MDLLSFTPYLPDGFPVFIRINILKNLKGYAPYGVIDDGYGVHIDGGVAMNGQIVKEFGNGRIYEYNDDIMTFLIMGIDKNGEVQNNRDATDGGQADALFLPS